MEGLTQTPIWQGVVLGLFFAYPTYTLFIFVLRALAERPYRQTVPKPMPLAFLASIFFALCVAPGVMALYVLSVQSPVLFCAGAYSVLLLTLLTFVPDIWWFFKASPRQRYEEWCE